MIQNNTKSDNEPSLNDQPDSLNDQPDSLNDQPDSLTDQQESLNGRHRLDFFMGCLFFLYASPILLFFIQICPITYLIIPAWLTAKFVHQPMIQNGIEDDKKWKEYLKEEEKSKEYHLKHPLICDNSNCDTNIYKFVTDKTPNGMVIMRYNKDEEGFEYWSDRTVDYKNLETVARKYVNVFECGGVYHDRKKILENKIKNLELMIEKRKAEMNKETNDISGNYIINNDSNTNNVDDGDVDNGVVDNGVVVNADVKKSNMRAIKDEDVFVKVKSPNKVEKIKSKLTKADYVCDVSNKYIHKGKLDDDREYLIVKKIAEPSPKKDNLSSWNIWKRSKKIK